MQMVTEELWQEIAKRLVNQLRETASASRDYKHAWGFYHLGASLHHWNRSWTDRQKTRLLSDRHFKTLHDAIATLASA